MRGHWGVYRTFLALLKRFQFYPGNGKRVFDLYEGCA